MISPRTFTQKKYLDLLSSSAPIVIATGPAGTGKTILACHAASRALVTGKTQRLILTRPAVSVDEGQAESDALRQQVAALRKSTGIMVWDGSVWSWSGNDGRKLRYDAASSQWR